MGEPTPAITCATSACSGLIVTTTFGSAAVGEVLESISTPAASILHVMAHRIPSAPTGLPVDAMLYYIVPIAKPEWRPCGLLGASCGRRYGPIKRGRRLTHAHDAHPVGAGWSRH